MAEVWLFAGTHCIFFIRRSSFVCRFVNKTRSGQTRTPQSILLATTGCSVLYGSSVFGIHSGPESTSNGDNFTSYGSEGILETECTI